MTQNTVDKQLAERIQKLLTEAHKCDPSALQSLLAVRVGCNSKLQGHHSIKTENGTVSVLGILNGLCGADGEDDIHIRALYFDGALIGFDTNCKPTDVKDAIERPVDPSYEAFGRDIHSEVQLRSIERFSDDYVGIMEGIIVDMVRKGLVHPTDWSVWLDADNRVAASYTSAEGSLFDHRGRGRFTRAQRSRAAWEIVVQYVMAREIQDFVARSPGPAYLKMAICLAEAGMANLVARGDIRNYKVSVHQHRDVQPILLPSDCGDMKSFSVGSILTDIICEFDVGGMPVGLNGPILYKSIVRLQ